LPGNLRTANHLFGRLGRDAPEDFAQKVGVDRRALFEQRRISARTVDLNLERNLFAVVFLCRRQDRLFDPLEHDLLVDILVAMDRIDDAQHFITVHGSPFPTTVSAGTHTTPCHRTTGDRLPQLPAAFRRLVRPVVVVGTCLCQRKKRERSHES
jgi:hypothetical protein